jgi:hypothetical protein
MKRALVALTAMSMILMGFSGVAAAQMKKLVWMKIPFPFYVGDQLLPAGQYSFQMPRIPGFPGGSIIRIQTKDNSVLQHSLSRRIDGVTSDAELHITFNKYGETYFLSKVRNRDIGAQMPKSRAEKTTQGEAAKIEVPSDTLELRAVVSKAK